MGFSFRKPGDLAAFLFLIAAAAFALLPVLWGLSTSFKTAPEVHAHPPTWIPDVPTLENWSGGVFSERFGRYLLNTILVVLGSLALSLTLSIHAAWATVRFRFVGRETLLLLMWATIMIPGACAGSVAC